MQPVVRSLAILTTVARHPGGVTLQGLAEELALPASTVHRLAAVLEQERYLVRTRRGKRFLLGGAVRGLLSSLDSEEIRSASAAAMARLARSSGETVFLAELVGTEAVCTAFVAGTRALRFFVQPGSALPLNAAASARVLLAALPPEEARGLLAASPLERLAPATMTAVAEVLAHLDTVRDRGYDICEDELGDHAWAVAAPLRDATGTVCAALAVIAPLQTLGDRARQQLLTTDLLQACTAVSEELGWTDVSHATPGPDGSASPAAPPR